MAGSVDDAFDRALTGRDVRVVFQPIVALHSGEVVGVEAFARGPEGTILEHPGPLFGAARRAGRLAELDWVARAAAFEAFTRADLPAAMSLCVNVEPESLGSPCPPDLVEPVSRAESLLRVFVEVTDQALAADPAGLVVAVDRARSSGWGVAVGGLGAVRTSLAALPVVGADLVKVDMSLFRRRDRAEVSAITLSVLRHVETSGAALLIQGVEDTADAEWARALGATYAQGYFFGRPGPLDGEYPVPREPIPLMRMASSEELPRSVFEVVSDLGTTRVTRTQLDELAQVVYRAALTPGAAPVVLASPGVGTVIPDERLADYPTPPTPPLLSVLFGPDVDDEPFEGMR
ncbi:EAL domain-containing protein, partial [Isoptericola sp. b441]